MRERLEGERIILRKAKLTDLDAIYENVYGDRELHATMFFVPSDSKEAAAQRLKRTIAYQQGKLLYFAARKDTDEAIGIGGMQPESDGVYCEAGLAIAAKYQGRGYGTEMLRLLLDYAFMELNAEQFAYYCMDINYKSKALAQHFGFHYDSSRQQIREYDGKELTVERYLLSRKEYLNRKV